MSLNVTELLQLPATEERQVWLQLIKSLMDERDQEREALRRLKAVLRDGYALLADGIESGDELILDYEEADTVRKQFYALMETYL